MNPPIADVRIGVIVNAAAGCRHPDDIASAIEAEGRAFAGRQHQRTAVAVRLASLIFGCSQRPDGQADFRINAVRASVHNAKTAPIEQNRFYTRARMYGAYAQTGSAVIDTSSNLVNRAAKNMGDAT